MWTLGKRKRENALNVTVKAYDGKVLIHFRHYFKVVGEDRWYPTKKGVALNLGKWEKLVESCSTLMPKWDNSVVRMSKLNRFLQQALKEIYSQHLAEKMTECVRCLCYGCMHAKDNKVMHNSCSLHASEQVHFCIYFALDFVEDAAILEQYGNKVGLAAFEWLDIFYPDNRHSTWRGGEEWITTVTPLTLDK